MTRGLLSICVLTCLLGCTRPPNTKEATMTSPEAKSSIPEPSVAVTMQLDGEQASPNVQAQAPESLPVFFAFNGASIRSSATDNLIELADYLRNEPQVTVVIDGYCDERGSEAYNLALGQRRADAVKAWLRTNGATKNDIVTVSHGKSMASACKDDDCWQRDRKSIINVR